MFHGPGCRLVRGRRSAFRQRMAGASDRGQTALVAVVALSVTATLIAGILVSTVINSDPLLQAKSVEIYANRALEAGVNAYVTALNTNPSLAQCNSNTNTSGICSGIDYGEWNFVPNSEHVGCRRGVLRLRQSPTDIRSDDQRPDQPVGAGGGSGPGQQRPPITTCSTRRPSASHRATASSRTSGGPTTSPIARTATTPAATTTGSWVTTSTTRTSDAARSTSARATTSSAPSTPTTPCSSVGTARRPTRPRSD